LLQNWNLVDAILDLRWDHVIMDEAHALKDPRGNRRTRVLCAPDMIPRVAGRLTLASGTILPNQPIECYNAIRLLDWDAIDRASVEDFRDYYYEAGEGWTWGRHEIIDRRTGEPVMKWGPHWSNSVRNQPRNLDDLQRRLRSRIMVRRLKRQVLPQLPPARWKPFPLELTPGLRKAMKHPGWGEAERLYEMDPEHFREDVSWEGEIAEARRLLGEAKAPLVADYVEELLEEGVKKIVIGAWHRSVLEELRRRLKKHGLCYMDGSTSAMRRQAEVDRFQDDPEVPIIVGQMQVIGQGWTLHAAADVVCAEPDWVPGTDEQLLDRIIRPGQVAEGVMGHLPVVPDSLDERIVSRAVEKDSHIYDALDRDWGLDKPE